MGYLIARNMSLSNLRINAKIKNGIETIVAVEASGSLFSSAIINAIMINANEIKRVRLLPNTIGNVLSPKDKSPFKSGRVVSNETEEKQKP